MENPIPPLSTEEELKPLVDNKLIKVREIKPILPPKPTITVSYPHNWRNLTQDFVGSLVGLILKETSKKPKDRILGSIFHEGSCYVDMNRERLVVNFLNHSQDSHLLMIDPDISFKDTLLEEFASLIQRAPEVGILAARVDIRNGLPVFYYQHPDGVSLVHYAQAFKGIREFDYVGTGVILLSREVLFSIYTQLNHAHMFSLMIEEGTNRKLGDDLSFCKRAKSLGHKVYGTWDIYCIHHKDYPIQSRYPSAQEVQITKRD
jgi:hypothetical protein